MIFKAVGDCAPYPSHQEMEQRDWSTIPPRQVRLDQLVTTRSTLDLRDLLDDDSTFFGDLFAHVVSWRGSLYLETGLHRALRAALQGRTAIHARVLDLDATGQQTCAPPPPAPPAPAEPTRPVRAPGRTSRDSRARDRAAVFHRVRRRRSSGSDGVA